ncbi:beta and beta-prime subunits of DNA dependent RNA-polymerase [Microthyrium microscopicum]|uniref:DNA-directed RNA polymerase subunit n=1 Tax=Microthyrium microscopicum TaxID=703497 RepID=A0A6A6TYM6_9PEZI|nr:beta and beta-prime subunits of DNA dependent RNA-polymerase [Microthyrium microscopicum]
MNPSRSIPSQIGSIEFGFLSSKDIKSLSVSRITNPTTFNSLLHPNVGGLYDPALGSFQNQPCATCHLRQLDGCPGHSGHIELPLKVYHPTYIDQLLRLLNGKCVFCHHFKIPRTAANRFISKLRLINVNALYEAASLDEQVAKVVNSESANIGSDSDAADDNETTIELQNRYVQKILKRKRREGTNTRADYTESVSEARKNLIKELMTEVGKDRLCGTCHGRSPRFRKERSVKVFMKGLNQKQMTHNANAELRMKNPLGIIAERRQREMNGVTPTKPRAPEDGRPDMMHYAVGGDGSDEASNSDGSQAGDALETEDMLLSKDIMEDRTTVRTTKKAATAADTYMGADEIHAAMVLLFEHESELLRLVYSPRSKGKILSALSADMFFIDTILVPPNRFRPENPGDGDAVTEHARNNLFKAILSCITSIQQIHQEMSGKKAAEQGRRIRGETELKMAQVELQENVNGLIDKGSSRFSNNERQADGIKQTLEKKEGLFRQNMMGKRVNFAGRSVISPDPNIETSEIGVPPVFASKLTYPEPVNRHNFYEMREAVINGPDTWPGAAAIELEDGQILSLNGKSVEERLALANQLLTPSEGSSDNGVTSKKVHRHLNNGDMVIMNRQPTLHKPSMMCHRVRVLVGEKTIRMHYANCNTYNADFDGDEMNMHFPQTELARAEANLIADTDHQYLSSTAGTPLRGLIQDHISISVHLSSRDTFYDREEYLQIIYAALRPEHGHTVSGRLQFVDPAIWKPAARWTGKQVYDTLLLNLTPEGHPGLTLLSKTKTPGHFWGDVFGKEEEKVLIKDGHLITGIIDKQHIGPSLGGLVHATYETLGHTIAGKLLSCIGRMLTKLLHMQAFSCGVYDLVMTPEGEKSRKELMKKANDIGLEAAAKYVTLEKQSPTSDDPELLRRLEEVLRDDEKQKVLDDFSKGAGGALSSEITRECLPNGLVRKFPKNQMQLMTNSGAKGSMVNANLISCNLGQQVLEGRRVPTMVSGKTLPCFKPFDSHVRAGGYIVDRFLTGVNPQEYYFHAMAGREGLIDTAVKTSRSGYLQRCLVKGMEGLRVEYDCSVRDSGDGSIVQFLYGEDGLDTCKSTYIDKFKFMSDNFIAIYGRLNVHEEYPIVHLEDAAKHNRKATRVSKRGRATPLDPAISLYNPSVHAGSMSEKYYRAVKAFVDSNPDNIFADKATGHKGLSAKAFDFLTEMQYLKALAEPGEAVGVVAAQSVGEPSTQMTLNTFHLAGHSSKNVTLGIPRLREIVMTASDHISTPNMTLTLQSTVTVEQGEKFAKEITRLSLAEVVDKTSVVETTRTGGSFSSSKFYKIRFDFFPAKEYEAEYNIKVRTVLTSIVEGFIPYITKLIAKEMHKRGVKPGTVTDAMPAIGQSAGRSEEHAAALARRAADSDDDSDDGENEEDMGMDAAKNRMKRSEMDDFGEAKDAEDLEAASQTSEAGDDDEDKRVEAIDKEDEEVDDDEEKDDSDNDRIYITDSASAISAYARGHKWNNTLCDFSFDPAGRWCEATLEYDADSHKLLMLAYVETATHHTVLQALPGIKSCVLDKKNKNLDRHTGDLVEEPAVITEGCNLMAIRDYTQFVNPDKVFTNDIAAVRKVYGVEACRANIVREMDAVFKGHAIDVDNRHLNLIADTMTRAGGYLPFSRNGMKNAVSAFMKMSFETTLGVLKEAVAGQETEDLKNPSAQLVVGNLSGVGTGSFKLMVPSANGQVRDDDEDSDSEMSG